MSEERDFRIPRLRRPEYTGENRCMPCTVVNLVIATALAGAVAVVSSLPVGAAVLVVSVALVAVRGYLVPGTPTLTARYLPDRLLALFDHQDTGDGADEENGVREEGIGAILLELGAAEECTDRDDMCLTDSFQAAWDEELSGVAGDSLDPVEVARLLDVEATDVDIQDTGGPVVLSQGYEFLFDWPSRPALIADVAAAQYFASGSAAWTELDPDARSAVLAGLRNFLEVCPDCGEALDNDFETEREGCCSEVRRYVVDCPECDARLLSTKVGENSTSPDQRLRDDNVRVA